MEKTILAIIRASTEHQETLSQKKELRDFILTKGFDEDEIEYIEVAGASARKQNPKYLQMLEDIKNKILTTPSIKNVALWHLNRLGRVKKCLTDMEHFFVSNKIQLYVKNGFDTPLLDDNGKETLGASIAFSVYSAMVEEETNEMFAKFERGKSRLKEEGKYAGGQLHFGYKLNDNRKYIIDPEQAKVVRLIFELYSTGKYSIYKLVDELNQRGVLKREQKLTYNIVRNILVDDSYLGYQSKRKCHWLPIIDQELFDKCAAIRNNTIAIKTTKESRNINFAVGLLKCECGNNYIAYGKSYMCYGKVDNHRKKKFVGCNSPVVPRFIIDEILVLVATTLHHAFLMRLDTASMAEYKDKHRLLNLKISTLGKEIETLMQRLEKLGDDFYVDGAMTEKQYTVRKGKLNSRIDEVQSQVSNYKNELKRVDEVIGQLSQSKEDRYLEAMLALQYDTSDMEDRKRLKSMMFQHIKDVRLKRFDEGRHKCIEITVNAENGLQFVFVYDTWLNNHRKKESYPTFLKYGDKLLPLRCIEGDEAVENAEITEAMEKLVELPKLTPKEMADASHNFAKRNIINAAIEQYKKDRGKDNLTDNEIEMITKQVESRLGF